MAPSTSKADRSSPFPGGIISETISTLGPDDANAAGDGRFLTRNDGRQILTFRPSLPTMSRRTHSRSLSNPFPSLFGGRKKAEQHANQNSLLDVVDDESTQLSRSVSPNRQQDLNPPDHNVIRRCMMCDHSNSFPSGKRGFRCGKCTTVHDLEPCHSSRLLQIPSGDGKEASGLAGKRKVSVEKTRNIIDHCLRSFFSNQLKSLGLDPLTGPDLPVTRRRGASESSLGTYRHEPPRHDAVGDLSTKKAEPTFEFGKYPDGVCQSTIPQSPKELPIQTKRKPVPSSSTVPSFDPQTHDQNQRQNISRPTLQSGGYIFRVLEDYIYASFDDCDTLNNSFLTPGSRHPRAASEGTPLRKSPENSPSPPNGSPHFQLDGKTLRLGDIAENGSWWAGTRPTRHRSINDNQNTRPNNTHSGLVSFKSPRINWPELSEWYHLVIHAGDCWRTAWHLMKPTNTDELLKWEAVELSGLEKLISESEFHLRTVLLKATEKLLQRPKRPLERPEDTRFLLILLVNPLLYPSSSSPRKPSAQLMVPGSGDRSRSSMPADRVPVPRRSHSALSNKAIAPSDRRSVIIKRIIGLLSNLPGECHHSLVSWFSRLSENQFRRLVDLVGSFVTYRLSKGSRRRPSKSVNIEDNIEEFVPTFSGPSSTTSAQLHSALQRDNATKPSSSEHKTVAYSDDWQMRAAARVMALLFRANHSSHRRRSPHSASYPPLNGQHEVHDHLHMIPISTFYNTLLDYSDLITDFEAWESRTGKFTFCQYSFFLSIWAKIRILEHDARRQMEAKAREAFFDNILGRRGTSQYLVLKVRRECLVEDSLRGVSEVVGSGQEEIKKGLRIEFVGEEGVDAGGLRKEWFLSLVREVFDPLNGSFLYDNDSRYCYFNPYCFESSEQFFLVGVVLGLAIYNSTILDVAFPPFAFRKLLASARPNNVPTLSTPYQPFRCTLDDLAEYRPALAKGLRQLLEYDGDVEETFCQDFVIQVERYGETIEVPLCPGGEKRPVTNSNRWEFVDLYVKYMLDDAVSRQFEPFKRGFFTVCGGNALHLFRPEEIELLVRGSDEALDIPSLRAVAVYEHWPTANPDRDPVVNWFWEFFTRVNPQDQRKILSFITGSDRIPAMGATNLVICLLYLGQDSERFPIARTCFNMLSLYRYKTRQKLESKLWRAVVESEGFGLK
ncbi:HECT-domain containing protein [Coccidioides posadasii C735 delta SOWgp]|uniref:HECT-type E3 ubiquitin transferase n=1 Tax=Coccidioides posadasii (strain C735) TaxID=222929 RepID=C5P0P4_COCP7|nr:HECT-domain containing protein [Coccidioides posadasii C735 delta SOWgp]EER29252.1 HECT-domain containing protein [Coccidioides posadasii C735 delta SOWgp]|eukprot:XP_003071397.1 HECT-domain containing protein [Coccidioides posadasii C735 delta SOWgp]